MKWEKNFVKRCKLSSTEEISNLPEMLQQAFEFLSYLPEEFNEEYMRKEIFERLFREDYCAATLVYWQEIDERIKFLWNSTGLKALSLLEDIAGCINSKNYFPALILTRALLENVAVFHFCFCQINLAHTKMMKSDIIGKITRKEIKATVVSRELEDLLIKYSHGTTLTELIEIQEKWKQTRISEYIQFLSRDKKYGKASAYYSFLCQVAHPNFGSTWAFYYGGRVVNEREMHRYGKKQSIDFFLSVASYPLNISCKILTDEIPQLRKANFV